MKCLTVSLPDVTPIQMITAKASYGVGFLTAFVGSFCSLFGIQNDLYADKLEKVEALAMKSLLSPAQALGADGVMDVRCQIDGLSFLVSGTAYTLSSQKNITPPAVTAVKEPPCAPEQDVCELCGKTNTLLHRRRISADIGWANICDECAKTL